LSTRIERIELRSFRNHESFDLKLTEPLVYIHGPNGSGKTSILESIYVIATTKSHRTTNDKEMITNGKDFAVIRIKTTHDRFQLVVSKYGKRTSINGVEKRKLSDFIGHLRVVMFAPEDLDLIKGSPSDRRRFLDLEEMQLSSTYLRDLTQYRAVLRQRNALLKRLGQGDDDTFLNILGEQLLDHGKRIIAERRKFIAGLNQELRAIHSAFSDHEVDMVYLPDVSEEGLSVHLQKQQKKDVLYQTTLAGPHRDDFNFVFNGFDAKSHASQGEQRLIVVALKFALLRTIERKTGQASILLLDDVLSELDDERRAILLKRLPADHQVIMNSTTPIEDKRFERIELAKGETP
ncbi:MAG: DNA replication/repair protein RecF, partial [Acholeplasmataceae bacterium]